jgi:hypothetical protein
MIYFQGYRTFVYGRRGNNMRKLSYLAWIVALCFPVFAAESVEPEATPYLFNGRVFYSDRPLAVMDGRLTYVDSGEDFVVATGRAIDANYRESRSHFCIGCKTIENTPLRLLKKLRIFFDKCLVKDIQTEPTFQEPVVKEQKKPA